MLLDEQGISVVSISLVGFPGDSKVSTYNAGDLGLTSVSERFHEEGNRYLLQYGCLENPWTVEPGRLQSMGLQNGRQN